MKTTLNLIEANNLGENGWEKLLKHLGKTEADDAPLSIATIIDSNDLSDALWCLRSVENHDREVRLFAVWCARQVQHLMKDPRSITVLDVAERFANGMATEDELHIAGVAARAAAETAADLAAPTAVQDASWAAAWASAFDAPDAAWASALEARDAVGDAARASAGCAQEAHLRKICAECDVEVSVSWQKQGLKMNAENSGFVVLSITDTGNAAFVDLGREEEIARIIEDASSKLESSSLGTINASLHDVNGNNVGHIKSSQTLPPDPLAEGGVRLVIERGDDAIESSGASEVARILQAAADKVRSGESSFSLFDINGNNVGRFEYKPVASLEKDGVVDLAAALNSDHVFLADDGFSGIADGQYRYVIPTNGFEPGYRQGEGDAWLVNANGDVAPGYEEPQTVRENGFRKLNAEERFALKAVVEGQVSFENFERQFDDFSIEP